MFAYTLASNLCSEATNIDDFILFELTVIAEAKIEFVLDRF